MHSSYISVTADVCDGRSAVGVPIAAGAAAAGGCYAARTDVEQVEDSSRGVTRDERENTTALIDWFACTFRPSPDFRDEIESIFGTLRLVWKRCRGGWQGYDFRIDLGPFGLLAYGGEHQRGTAHLSLNAHGCKGVQDWNAVRIWCGLNRARITRVDLAHDDFSGEHINIAKALTLLDEGQFTTGGRAPSARLIDDLGSNKGKTLYIGQRQNGKLCRVYEKGKQLGDPQSPWCRVEVEFRGKSREIPHDVLTRPGDYFAGAYPCLAHLSECQDKIRTLSKASDISYERMVDCLRTQYGTTLHVMMRVEGGDIFRVFEQVERPGTPKRLQNLPLPRGESRKGDA